MRQKLSFTRLFFPSFLLFHFPISLLCLFPPFYSIFILFPNRHFPRAPSLNIFQNMYPCRFFKEFKENWCFPRNSSEKIQELNSRTDPANIPDIVLQSSLILLGPQGPSMNNFGNISDFSKSLPQLK